MVASILEQNSVFITVDFECFTHDLCRAIGTTNSPKLRTQALLESIENLEELLIQTNQTNKRVTFFCTGVTADLYPDIIKLIASKGHEIACHGNFHDDIFKMSAKDVYTSLSLAKDKLSQLIQNEVRGFRAPRFSIDKYDFERLSQISKVFDYDSSLHFEDKSEYNGWKQKCPVELVEFPVPKQRFSFLNFEVKTGGSYLKIFPDCIVKNTIISSSKKGLIPILYLHPYDLYYGYDMLAQWSELEGATNKKYWYIRQIQWAGMFNSIQKKKLFRLFDTFQNIGALGDNSF